MKNIRKVIKNSNNSAKEFMLAYLDGKTTDPMVLSLIINEVQYSNNEEAINELMAIM